MDMKVGSLYRVTDQRKNAIGDISRRSYYFFAVDMQDALKLYLNCPLRYDVVSIELVEPYVRTWK